MSEQTVVNNLEETRILIRQDRVEELFKEWFQNTSNFSKYKLEGVDYAYFTKIFFSLTLMKGKSKTIDS